jgi:hypothetical protein
MSWVAIVGGCAIVVLLVVWVINLIADASDTPHD